MGVENDPLVEYGVLKEKSKTLIKAYNKLIEKTNCPCGATILCDGHKESCIKPRIIKQVAYKKLASLLFEMLMCDRQLQKIINKL